MANCCAAGRECFELWHVANLWDADVLSLGVFVCDALSDQVILMIQFTAQAEDRAGDLMQFGPLIGAIALSELAQAVGESGGAVLLPVGLHGCAQFAGYIGLAADHGQALPKVQELLKAIALNALGQFGIGLTSSESFVFSFDPGITADQNQALPGVGLSECELQCGSRAHRVAEQYARLRDLRGDSF